MKNRKDELRNIFAGRKPIDVSNECKEHGEAPSRRLPSGAVKAMGMSLNELAREVGEAKRLQAKLLDGNAIIELDPQLIDLPIIADRLTENHEHDDAFAKLKKSIFENGQQVPVLLRKHSDLQKAAQGLYQAAYGHRRIRAAKELCIPVKAIVRNLSDSDLVVAQGNENAGRRDLSYIERAFFAKSMIAKGFDRRTAQAALCVDKTEMSRLLQVAEKVPEHIARSIGPAPKVGRSRWLNLGSLFSSETSRVKAQEEITGECFRSADSDTRFQMLFNRLNRTSMGETEKSPDLIRDRDGKVLGKLSSSAKRTQFEISAADHRTFAGYLARELPGLVAAFRASRNTDL